LWYMMDCCPIFLTSILIDCGHVLYAGCLYLILSMEKEMKCIPVLLNVSIILFSCLRTFTIVLLWKKVLEGVGGEHWKWYSEQEERIIVDRIVIAIKGVYLFIVYSFLGYLFLFCYSIRYLFE